MMVVPQYVFILEATGIEICALILFFRDESLACSLASGHLICEFIFIGFFMIFQPSNKFQNPFFMVFF